MLNKLPIVATLCVGAGLLYLVVWERVPNGTDNSQTQSRLNNTSSSGEGYGGVVTAGGAATCDPAIQRPSGYSNVRVSPNSEIDQVEISIAVNPEYPHQLLMGANTHNRATCASETFSNQGSYYSNDHGSTWVSLDSIPSSDLCPDPAVAFGPDSSFYHAWLQMGAWYPDVKIGVDSSSYGGGGWGGWDGPPRNCSGEDADKPHMLIDPASDRVFLVFSQITGGAGCPNNKPILFSRALTSDLDFDSAIGISGTTAPFFAHAANLALRSPDTLFSVWACFSSHNLGFIDIGFTRSYDAGVTWRTAEIISDTGFFLGLRRHIKDNQLKANAYPTIAVDTSGTSYHGTLYAVWGDQRHWINAELYDPDIFLMRSTDDGASWSDAVRVNSDSVWNYRDQWFPWVDVDPYGGVNIVFFDSRDDTSNYLTEAYVARSIDGGETFHNFRVSNVAFNPCPVKGAYIGDYIGITSNREFVFPAWADNRTPHPDTTSSCGLFQAYIAQVPIGDTLYATGSISADTEWSGYVMMTGDVTIESGYTLTIKPWTKIIATASSDDQSGGADTTLTELIIEGTLVLEDSAGTYPLFTSTVSSPGSWYGIRLQDNSDLDSRGRCRVRRAVTGLTIDSTQAPDTLAGWSFQDCEDHAIVTYSDSVALLGTAISSVDSGVGIYMSGADALIENCLIDSCTVGIAAIGSSPTINGGAIRNVSDDGILIWSGGHATISGVTISGAGGDGISINVADTSIATTVDGCVISDVARGIYIVSSAAEITGTHIQDAEDYGIYVVSGHDVTLLQDTITDCSGGTGVYLGDCDATIKECLIENCDYGIYTDEAPGTLEDNVILGPGSYGIYVANSEEYPGDDTLSIVNDSVAGYFAYALLNAATRGHCRIDSCHFIGDTNASGVLPPYGVKALSSAWVRIRHSKIVDYATAGFYSFRSTANLGEMPDAGNNSIYVTGGPVSCEPKSAIHIEFGGFGPGPPQLPTLKAEGNWWGTDEEDPESCWFTLIDFNPWLDDDPLAKRVEHFVVQSAVPDEFSVSQNYPNPFNPSTVIEFSLPVPTRTTIEIFNVLGQRVRVLTDEELPAGKHTIEWDGRGAGGRPLASGIYLYRLSAGTHTATRKMVLLK